MTIFTRIRNSFRKPDLSETARTILAEEEIRGAKILNGIRYFFVVNFIIGTLINLGTGDLLFNFINLGVYVTVTVAHTFVLRSGQTKLRHFFDYFALVIDFAVFFAIGVFYTITAAGGNVAMAVKNPFIYLTLLPLIGSMFQFRLRLLVFGCILFLLCYTSLLVWGFLTTMPISADWPEYVLGPGVLIEDLFVSRPMTIVGVTLIVFLGIIRSLNLVNRIAQAESHKASLERYFSPDVAKELMENPDLINTGARQQVTILFSDIRNFTRISESMEPGELSEFLSHFRGVMADAIFRNNGSVDKFIGDAIMANFGVPKPSSEIRNDSRYAVQAGLAMHNALSEFNQARISAGKEPIEIGIGIHCGEVFAGNLGRTGHMEYTVIGDTVNTASRIESACKALGANFLISAEVLNHTHDLVEVKDLPRIKVKGKSEPLTVYSVLGSNNGQAG